LLHHNQTRKRNKRAKVETKTKKRQGYTQKNTLCHEIIEVVQKKKKEKEKKGTNEVRLQICSRTPIEIVS